MGTLKTMSRPIAMHGSRDLVPMPKHENLPVTQEQEGGVQQAHAIMPNGQNINVVTNHNIHLPFKEWILRGIVGSLGAVLAFPFRVIGNAVNTLVEGVIGIIKIAIIIVLAPTLAWLGFMLLGEMQEQDSVEGGTAAIVEHAGDVASGIGKGIDGESGN